MYLVEWIVRGGTVHTLAVSDQRALFDILWVLDASENINAWKIVDKVPSDFGWANTGWIKLVSKYESEHFK